MIFLYSDYNLFEVIYMKIILNSFIELRVEKCYLQIILVKSSCNYFSKIMHLVLQFVSSRVA